MVKESFRVELIRVLPDVRVPVEHVDEDDRGRALRHGQAVDGGLLFDSPPDDRHRRIKSGKKMPAD